MHPHGMFRPGTPGDNGPPTMRPEIVAAEQRILTYVDALLVWMRKSTDWPDSAADAVDLFMTHKGPNPLLRREDDPCADAAEIKVTHYILDKLDRDANQFMFEILRAAWERRCWQTLYGERKSPTD